MEYFHIDAFHARQRDNSAPIPPPIDAIFKAVSSYRRPGIRYDDDDRSALCCERPRRRSRSAATAKSVRLVLLQRFTTVHAPKVTKVMVNGHFLCCGRRCFLFDRHGRCRDDKLRFSCRLTVFEQRLTIKCRHARRQGWKLPDVLWHRARYIAYTRTSCRIAAKFISFVGRHLLVYVSSCSMIYSYQNKILKFSMILFQRILMPLAGKVRKTRI